MTQRLRSPRLLLLWLLAPLLAQAQWREGTIVGVVADSPTQRPPLIFVNTWTGEGLDAFPMGVWTDVHTAGLVPAGVIAVDLTGIMIITHGWAVEICDLTIAFRRKGTTREDYPYAGQVIEASTQNGQRTNYTGRIPVDDHGVFQLKWVQTPAYPVGFTWPLFCAYDIDLRLTGYLR